MITLTLLTILYFLPTIVAANRGHGVIGIFLLNFFFGWTGLGWLGLMLWALLSQPRCYCVPVPVFHPYYGWRRY
jgi:hypothetical protein